jgi:hypothetical protein
MRGNQFGKHIAEVGGEGQVAALVELVVVVLA